MWVWLVWGVVSMGGLEAAGFRSPDGVGLVVWRAERGCSLAIGALGCGSVVRDTAEDTLDLDGSTWSVRLVGGQAWTGMVTPWSPHGSATGTVAP